MTRDEWAKRPMAERSAAAHCICNYALDLPDVPAQEDWSARSLVNIALIGGFGNCDWRKAAIEYVRNAPAPADLTPYLAAAAILVASTPEPRTVQEIVRCARALRAAARGAQ